MAGRSGDDGGRTCYPREREVGEGFIFYFSPARVGCVGITFAAASCRSVYLAGLSIYGTTSNANDISPSCVYKWKKKKFCNASYTVYSSVPSIFFPLLQLYERPYSQPCRCPLRKKKTVTLLVVPSTSSGA